MLIFRQNNIGWHIERIFIKCSNNYYLLRLESISKNFHKRFHHFTIRRWILFDIDDNVIGFPAQLICGTRDELVNIRKEDLITILERSPIKFDLSKLEDVVL